MQHPQTPDGGSTVGIPVGGNTQQGVVSVYKSVSPFLGSRSRRMTVNEQRICCKYLKISLA